MLASSRFASARAPPSSVFGLECTNPLRVEFAPGPISSIPDVGTLRQTFPPRLSASSATIRASAESGDRQLTIRHRPSYSSHTLLILKIILHTLFILKIIPVTDIRTRWQAYNKSIQRSFAAKIYRVQRFREHRHKPAEGSGSGSPEIQSLVLLTTSLFCEETACNVSQPPPCRNLNDPALLFAKGQTTGRKGRRIHRGSTIITKKGGTP